MHGKNIGKTFWVHFFGGSNGTIVSSRVGPPIFFFFLREPPPISGYPLFLKQI